MARVSKNAPPALLVHEISISVRMINAYAGDVRIKLDYQHEHKVVVVPQGEIKNDRSGKVP